jgi:hypothetical protein
MEQYPPPPPFDFEAQLYADNQKFADGLLRSYGYLPGTREYQGFYQCVFLLCDGRLLDDALGCCGFTRDDVMEWRKINPTVEVLLKRAAARGNYSDAERFEKADKIEAYKLTIKRRHKEAQTWFSVPRKEAFQQTGDSLDSLFGGAA